METHQHRLSFTETELEAQHSKRNVFKLSVLAKKARFYKQLEDLQTTTILNYCIYSSTKESLLDSSSRQGNIWLTQVQELLWTTQLLRLMVKRSLTSWWWQTITHWQPQLFQCTTKLLSTILTWRRMRLKKWSTTSATTIMALEVPSKCQPLLSMPTK